MSRNLRQKTPPPSGWRGWGEEIKVAQVFNLCCGGVLLSHVVGGTGFQPGGTGQRPVPPVSLAWPGLTAKFGRGVGMFLFIDQRIMLRLVQGFDFDIRVQIRPMQLGGR